MAKIFSLLIVFIQLNSLFSSSYHDIPEELQYSEIPSRIKNLRDLSSYTSTHRKIYDLAKEKIWPRVVKETISQYPDLYRMDINFFPQKNSSCWYHMARIRYIVENIKQDLELPTHAFQYVRPGNKPGIEIKICGARVPRKVLGIQLETATSFRDIRNLIQNIYHFLQDENIEEGLRGLIGNTSITGFNFEGWNLTSQMRSYGEIILEPDHFPSLKILNLNHSSLNNEDACTLACYLSAHPTLQSLNLHENSITCIGGGSLSAMLRHNTSLTELDLRGNWIGEEEIKKMNKIWKKIRHNSFLKIKNNQAVTDKKDHYREINY